MESRAALSTRLGRRVQPVQRGSGDRAGPGGQGSGPAAGRPGRRDVAHLGARGCGAQTSLGALFSDRDRGRLTSESMPQNILQRPERRTT